MGGFPASGAALAVGATTVEAPLPETDAGTVTAAGIGAFVALLGVTGTSGIGLTAAGFMALDDIGRAPDAAPTGATTGATTGALAAAAGDAGATLAAGKGTGPAADKTTSPELASGAGGSARDASAPSAR